MIVHTVCPTEIMIHIAEHTFKPVTLGMVGELVEMKSTTMERVLSVRW